MGKKPLDKAIEDYSKTKLSEVTYVSRLEQEVKQQKHIVKGYRFEITTLKKSLSKAGELIEELISENKLQKNQLFKLGQAIDTLTGNKKGESDHE